jgi:hypothetical protein
MQRIKGVIYLTHLQYSQRARILKLGIYQLYFNRQFYFGAILRDLCTW